MAAKKKGEKKGSKKGSKEKPVEWSGSGVLKQDRSRKSPLLPDGCATARE